MNKLYKNSMMTSVRVERDLIELADSLGIVRTTVFTKALEEEIFIILNSPNARVNAEVLSNINKYFNKKSKILEKKHLLIDEILEKQQKEQTKLSQWEENKEKITQNLKNNFKGGLKYFNKWLPENDFNGDYHNSRIQLCKQLSNMLGFEVSNQSLCEVIREGLKEAGL